MNKKTVIIGAIVWIFIVVGVVVIVNQPETPRLDSIIQDVKNTNTQSAESVVGTSTETITQKQFTLAEVAQHASKASCYTAVKGNVYDLTPAIDAHPGGAEKMMRICGIEGTSIFTGKHGGQPLPEAGLAKLQIGVLIQ
ncbi:MAG: cytochrome b5-like heme/steroid binding domain-containing protein [Candidatus Paceibacterota bacterium]